MNPRKETIAELEGSGFVFARHGANHDIYFNPATGVTIPVKRHDFDEDDKRYILKEAALNKNKQDKRKDK